MIHIDYSPVKDCKHPEWTYNQICVKCGECGRFEKGGDRNPVRSDIKLITQSNAGIPPDYGYPREEGGYFEPTHYNTPIPTWYRRTEKIVKGTTLEDIIPAVWYPERKVSHLRWWIEGRNY